MMYKQLISLEIKINTTDWRTNRQTFLIMSLLLKKTNFDIVYQYNQIYYFLGEKSVFEDRYQRGWKIDET